MGWFWGTGTFGRDLKKMASGMCCLKVISDRRIWPIRGCAVKKECGNIVVPGKEVWQVCLEELEKREREKRAKGAKNEEKLMMTKVKKLRKGDAKSGSRRANRASDMGILSNVEKDFQGAGCGGASKLDSLGNQ